MSVSRTRIFLGSIVIGSLSLPVFAQTPAGNSIGNPGGREASFLGDGPPVISDPVFSGLATAPPELSPSSTLSAAAESTPSTPLPPAPTPPPIPSAPPPAPKPPTNPPAPAAALAPKLTPAPAATVAVPPAPPPASATPPPAASDESIGMPAADNLGTTIWKGTPRSVAEKLLSMAAPTTSPVLNDLMQRLLLTSASPPEGASQAAQSLTSMRIEKLVTFGDPDAAWTLAKHADAKLVDDVTFHFAAESELANDPDELCGALASFTKQRDSADWRKAIAVCGLRAKDTKIAQDALNLLAADTERDDMFLEVANKNVLAAARNLPPQLTPLSPEMLALLQLANQPLPAELYSHPDNALIPPLLRATPKQDVVQLGLAERAAARGLIAPATLGTVYRSITFRPDELAAPLTATESGMRLRALLYQAARTSKSPSERISFTGKFMQSSPPELLNGAGALLADMLGVIPADGTLASNAVTVARAYVLAGRGDQALDWLKLAHRNPGSAAELNTQWPFFALAGLEAEGDYTANFTHWLDAALQTNDPQADIRAQRDLAAAQMLLLDAAGFAIPDSAWARVLSATHSDKHAALSALLLGRLQSAGNAGRRGETILLATDLAGEGDISLPAALAIARGLRGAGLKSESASFASQTMVLLMAKQN